MTHAQCNPSATCAPEFPAPRQAAHRHMCAGVSPAQRQQPRGRAFNPVEQHDPTLLAPFESVLGLAAQQLWVQLPN